MHEINTIIGINEYNEHKTHLKIRIKLVKCIVDTCSVISYLNFSKIQDYSFFIQSFLFDFRYQYFDAVLIACKKGHLLYIYICTCPIAQIYEAKLKR